MKQESQELDKYGGLKSVSGTKTGYFHIETFAGRQWMVTPLGNAFMPVALSHPYTGETAYICREKFGGDYERYVRDSFDKLIGMGFNCSLSEHTNPERNMNGFVQPGPILDLYEERTFPYTVGIYLLKHPLEFQEGETYPDIFDDAYLNTWAETIRRTCLEYKDNPLVMGYYYGYGGLNDEVGLIHTLLEMPELSPGRQILLEYFVAKYRSNLGRYNQAYGRDAQTENDIRTEEGPRFPNEINQVHMADGPKDLDPDLVEDFETLVEMIAVHLYSFGHTEIRKWDTNHLIIGAYLKAHSLTARAWKAVAPFVDTISPQHIVATPDIDEFIRASGLPCLVSDQLFGIVYPEKIRFAAVDSHEWRGRLYAHIHQTAMSNPGIVGVSYCNCLYDQVDPASRLAVGEQGIYESDGRERPEISGPIKEANRAVYEMAQRCGDGSEYQKNAYELTQLWKSASAGVSKDPDRQWKPTKETR